MNFNNELTIRTQQNLINEQKENIVRLEEELQAQFELLQQTELQANTSKMQLSERIYKMEVEFEAKLSEKQAKIQELEMRLRDSLLMAEESLREKEQLLNQSKEKIEGESIYISKSKGKEGS